MVTRVGAPTAEPDGQAAGGVAQGAFPKGEETHTDRDCRRDRKTLGLLEPPLSLSSVLQRDLLGPRFCAMIAADWVY